MSTQSQIQSQEVFESLRRANYLNAVQSYKVQVKEGERTAAMEKEVIRGERIQSERIEEHVKTKATSRITVETGDQIEAAPEQKDTGKAPQLTLAAPQTSKPNDPFAPNLQDVSLVAVLGEALAAQARSSSTLYSSFFQQATQSMMASASLIEPTVDAVNSNWQQQAAATTADATKSSGDGWINMIFGGAVMAMGLYGAWQESGKPVAGADETEDLNEAEETEENQSKKTAEADDAASKSANNDKAKANDASENAKKDAAKGGNKNIKNLVQKGDEASDLEKNLKSGGKKFKGVMECLYKGFTKAAGTAAGFQMLATGIAGVSVDSKQEGIKAAAQTNAGKFDSESKAGEMYAQFYTQGFNRTEDLRQGTAQNVDLSVNILKSGADTITQAITSQRI